MSMPIVSLTATQIVVKVPADVASGKIRVITPKGIAVSAGYFYVPITGYADADIVDRQSVTIGGAASTVNVATANKYGLLLFDGAGNDYVSLQLSAYTNSVNTSTSYSIYKPDNTLFSNGSIYASSLTLHIPRLPLTGTYSVVFAPGASTTSLTGKLVRDGSITAGAVATTATRSVAGQSLRYSFTVNLGGTVGIGLTGLSYIPNDVPTQSYQTDMRLYKPDGALLLYTTCFIPYNNGGCNLDLVNVAVAGTYSVVIVPPTVATSASFTLALSAPVAGALTIDSASGTAVALTRPGQNARYTFTATAGQNLGVGVSDLVITPNTVTQALLTAYRADGSLYNSATCNLSQTGCTLNMNNLAAGTYSVLVSLTQGATGSFKLQVNNDAVGTLVANVVSNVSLKPGQNARYTFSGTAGQSVGIELAQLVTVPNPSNRTLNVYVYQPTDTVALSGTTLTGYWQSGYIYNTGGTLSLPALPTTGTYTVIVDDPTYGVAATFALKLNAGTPLVAGAAATTVTTTGAGQNPRFTFDVALGGTVGIGLTGLSYIPNDVPTQSYQTDMRLYKPDGALLLYTTCFIPYNNGGCNLDLVNVAVAGTYSVVIVPPTVATSASFTLALSAPVAGALTIDSASGTAVALTRPGQNARYTFTATAGQNLGVGVSDLVITPNTVTQALLTAYRADGSLYNSATCNLSQTGCTLNMNNLAAGTYSVLVSLTQGATGSFKLQVNNDAVGTLVANVVSNVSLKPGQNARYTFSGTAGQSVGIELAQLVTVPNPSNRTLNVYVYQPTDTVALSGTTLTGYWQSGYIYNTGGTLSLPALPTTGTYTVIVDDPTYGVAATFALKAISP
jgi:trimeric autotransporter adhesin